MITRYAVWLNGQGLQDMDEAVIITDVQEASPRIRLSTAANARYAGQHITQRVRQSLTVTVSFLLREYDTARRKQLADRICAWAEAGGWLTISDRPGQRLWVVCEEAPYIASSLRWTGTLRAVFTAYAQPYWQDEYPTQLTLTAAANTLVSAALQPCGTAPHCFLEAEIMNTGSGLASSLTIAANETVFHLNNAALIPAGGTLTISYDSKGLLSIRQGDISMLAARSANSDDDLLLTPAALNEVSITCDQPIKTVLKTRGLYL